MVSSVEYFPDVDIHLGLLSFIENATPSNDNPSMARDLDSLCVMGLNHPSLKNYLFRPT